MVFLLPEGAFCLRGVLARGGFLQEGGFGRRVFLSEGVLAGGGFWSEGVLSGGRFCPVPLQLHVALRRTLRLHIRPLLRIFSNLKGLDTVRSMQNAQPFITACVTLWNMLHDADFTGDILGTFKTTIRTHLLGC